MNRIVDSFRQYIEESLGVSLEVEGWQGIAAMPAFVRSSYRLFQTSMNGLNCLLIVPSNENSPTPSVLEKHIALLRRKWAGEFIYLRESITSYNRQRLMQRGIPFVVPFNQMYLPAFGLHLRESFKNRQSSVLRLSPSAQAVLLFGLYDTGKERLTPSFIAARLGYSGMTLTRAFRELDILGLADVRTRGRDRVLHWADDDRKALWGKALEFLRTPVKQRVWLSAPHQRIGGFIAGLSALSSYSMLASPGNPVLAMNSKDLKAFRENCGIRELDSMEKDEDSLEIEVWTYSPGLFNKNGTVDKLSLYLSLRETTDERVQSALQIMMEGFDW
ncbi:MAG: hypothetical protein AO396_01435 [Candidatus Fermentibacter daniensis]|jgi:hypothetical protein|nr:MAG: hypothetical protein AO396_01435 [Candidatus Fermentibacter daniensis]